MFSSHGLFMDQDSTVAAAAARRGQMGAETSAPHKPESCPEQHSECLSYRRKNRSKSPVKYLCQSWGRFMPFSHRCIFSPRYLAARPLKGHSRADMNQQTWNVSQLHHTSAVGCQPSKTCYICVWGFQVCSHRRHAATIETKLRLHFCHLWSERTQVFKTSIQNTICNSTPCFRVCWDRQTRFSHANQFIYASISFGASLTRPDPRDKPN